MIDNLEQPDGDFPAQSGLKELEDPVIQLSDPSCKYRTHASIPWLLKKCASSPISGVPSNMESFREFRTDRDGMFTYELVARAFQLTQWRTGLE